MPQIGLVQYVDEVALQIQNGQIDEATAHCRHILSHYPMYIPVYRLLGYANLEQGDYAHATHFFQCVLSADPEDADAWANLAMLSDDLGELEQAIWLMERAFEIEPGNAETRDRLRHFYSHRDGVERVRIKLTPTALGRLYAASGFYRRAAQEFERTLRNSTLHPLHVAYLEVNLARALVQIPGMAPMADKVCRSLLQKLPKSLMGNLIMGQIRRSAGLDQEAAPYLQIARALDPEGRVGYKTLGHQSPVELIQVEIPHLEYKAERGPVERALEAPPSAEDTSWLDHIGETLGVSAEVTQATEGAPEAPGWLQEWSSEALESTPPQSTESVQDQATAIQQEPTEPAIPDWLRDLQRESTSPPAVGSEVVAEAPEQPPEEETLPEWLQEFRPEAEAPAFEVAEPEVGEEQPIAPLEVEELPDWLQELRTETEAPALEAVEPEVGEEEPIAALEEEELPDWLRELRPETEAPALEAVESEVGAEEPIAALEEEELPDWLRELRPEAEAPALEAVEPEVGEEQPIAALEEEELPDWLRELRPEAEAPVLEAVEPEVGEEQPIAALEEEELPDWLRELRPEAEAPAFEVAEPEVGEERPIAPLEAEELPDWLQELRPESQTVQPTQALEPEEPEELPSWLQALRAEPEITTPEPAAEPPAEEEIPDWLQELQPEGPVLATDEITLISEAEPAAESPAQAPVEPLDEAELPEWLRELRPQSGVPVTSVLPIGAEATQEELEGVVGTAGAAGAQVPPPVEGMPNWLVALEAEISGQVQPLEPAAVPQPAVAGEPQVEVTAAHIEIPPSVAGMPKWLTDLEVEIAGVTAPAVQEAAPPMEEAALPIEEAPVTAEMPAPAEEMPSWLIGLESEVSGQAPVLTAPEVAAEPEPEPTETRPEWLEETVFSQQEEQVPEWLEELQTEPADQITVEEMPDWLERLRSQEAETQAASSEQPIASEEEMEWLQTLIEMPEPPMPERDLAQPAAPTAAQEPERAVSLTEVPAAVPAQLLVQARAFLQQGALDVAVEAYTPLTEAAELTEQVIHDLEQATRDHPHHSGLCQVLGDAYMRSGQLQKALQTYQRALANL